ncbi:MAG: type IV pilus modification protein PilV [Gammaproteobacteria bacterium]|nr:type IV pilus modification protein PilV [Gammaproteobacteria bacterium]
MKMNTVTTTKGFSPKSAKGFLPKHAKGFLPKRAKGFLPKRAKGFLPKQAKGFSMLELLVAVLVMGVGVLGVTGLQMVSLQNNQDALLRGDALQQAYDILDRIRVNPGAAVPGIAYDG